VSDVNIVTGDLEALSSDTADVASQIGTVDLVTAMADAPSAMTGSASASSWIEWAAPPGGQKRAAPQGQVSGLQR